MKGTGDFITAYLDHGVSPTEASYEYMLLVKPGIKEVKSYSKKSPYVVIQADNSAHVVKDNLTGITAYIIYKEYYGSGTLLLSSDPETIVMERPCGDGSSVMSICTPDLGITLKGYTTSQSSQPVLKRVILDGEFVLADECQGVSLVHESGKTVVTASCIHGQPVEFKLKR